MKRRDLLGGAAALAALGGCAVPQPQPQGMPALVAGDAPHMATLLGRHYVAMRAPDGEIGFFDEGCPHRGASLALARVEDGHLRCIFHAWKFDIHGQAVECPTELGDRAAAFCARVKLKSYPVHEAGGLAWVWLGDTAKAPPFPSLPFVGDLEGNAFLTVSRGQCNWLQGVEATLERARHYGSIARDALAIFPDSLPRSALADVVSFCVNRAH